MYSTARPERFGVISNHQPSVAAMVWNNMMAASKKLWTSKPEHSDVQYRTFVVRPFRLSGF